jgi:hypothetical protein
VPDPSTPKTPFTPPSVSSSSTPYPLFAKPERSGFAMVKRRRDCLGEGVQTLREPSSVAALGGSGVVAPEEATRGGAFRPSHATRWSQRFALEARAVLRNKDLGDVSRRVPGRPDRLNHRVWLERLAGFPHPANLRHEVDHEGCSRRLLK